MQGNLGSVSPGIMCPINARSIPSSKFPVTSGVGTLCSLRFLPAPQAPRSLCRGDTSLGAGASGCVHRAGASRTGCSRLRTDGHHEGTLDLPPSHLLFLPGAPPHSPVAHEGPMSSAGHIRENYTQGITKPFQTRGAGWQPFLTQQLAFCASPLTLGWGGGGVYTGIRVGFERVSLSYRISSPVL